MPRPRHEHPRGAGSTCWATRPARAGIIAGAIAIHYTGWLKIDPVLSILIGLIGSSGRRWGIIQDSLNILLEGLAQRAASSQKSRQRVRERRRRDRRARSAHLEPGFGSPRAELPRADRGHASVGQRIHSALHQSRCCATGSPFTTPPSSSSTPSARWRTRRARKRTALSYNRGSPLRT